MRYTVTPVNDGTLFPSRVDRILAQTVEAADTVEAVNIVSTRDVDTRFTIDTDLGPLHPVFGTGTRYLVVEAD